eukprot:m.54882 g.54882  ORF g.54882 m.54882 type:complete len:619 (-) comp21986_c0_seq1:108-1964(-)
MNSMSSMIATIIAIFATTIVAQEVDTSASRVQRQTCAQLGWKIKSGIYGTNTEVCASSEITGKCFSKADFNYNQTKNLCAAAGARLCTLAELETNIAPPTNCNAYTNLRMVWSSTPCDTAGHMVVMGKSDSGQPPVCAADTAADYTVRCCSDRDRVGLASLPWVKISLQPSEITQNLLAIIVMVTGFSGNHTDVRSETTLVGYNDVGLVVGVKSTTSITLATHKTLVSSVPDIIFSISMNINQRKFTSVDRFELSSVLVDVKTGVLITHTLVSGKVLPVPSVDTAATFNVLDQEEAKEAQEEVVVEDQGSPIQMGENETSDGPAMVCVNAPAMWQDKDHMSCQDYDVSEWCTSSGYGTAWDETWGNFTDYAAPLPSDSTKLFSASEVCCKCGGGEYKLRDDVDSDFLTSTSTEPDVDEVVNNANEILDKNTTIIIGVVCAVVVVLSVSVIKCYCCPSSSKKRDETNWYIHKVMRMNRKETNFSQSECGDTTIRGATQEVSFDVNALKLLRGTMQHRPSSLAIDGVFRPVGARNEKDQTLRTLKTAPKAKNIRAPSELFSTHPLFVQMQQVPEEDKFKHPTPTIKADIDDDGAEDDDDGYLATLPDCEIVEMETAVPPS